MLPLLIKHLVKRETKEVALRIINDWNSLRSRFTVFGLFFLFCVFGSGPGVSQSIGSDAMSAAVDLFMQARMLESDVEARKLMTAHLENRYMHSKRLSIRVKSGRVVSYNFDPARIRSSGEKEFQVEVESLWADLNEIVYATQYERIRFIKVKGDWLADDIDFLKSVPRPRLLPFNVVSEKRGKAALSVAKVFMKGLINRNPTLIVQRSTQEFQSRFESTQEMEHYLYGPSEARFVAYEPSTLTQKEPGEMEVKVRLFAVVSGKRGAESQEARLTVTEGKTDWNVSEFEFLGEKPQ